jgi:hypothetical protein
MVRPEGSKSDADVLRQLAHGPSSRGINPVILLFTKLVFLIYSPVAESSMA